VTTHTERLAALGLTLPPVTAPVAAYVPAVQTGSYIYVSGQVPVADGKVAATGTHSNNSSAQASTEAGPAISAARAGRASRPAPRMAPT